MRPQCSAGSRGCGLADNHLVALSRLARLLLHHGVCGGGGRRSFGRDTLHPTARRDRRSEQGGRPVEWLIGDGSSRCARRLTQSLRLVSRWLKIENCQPEPVHMHDHDRPSYNLWIVPSGSSLFTTTQRSTAEPVCKARRERSRRLLSQHDQRHRPRNSCGRIQTTQHHTPHCEPIASQNE